MEIQLTPTPQMFDIKLRDGRTMPTRIWKGLTNNLTLIDAYVFCIVPTTEQGKENLQRELPDFMITDRGACLEVDPNRYTYISPEQVRAVCLELFGREETKEDVQLVNAFVS